MYAIGDRPDRDVSYDQRVVHLFGVIATAAGAFVGTNLDDLVVLVLLILGMPEDKLRTWQIYFGQYVGFAGLLVISLLASSAMRVVPARWLGLLALIPIALGVRALVRVMHRRDSEDGVDPILASGILPVAAITMANGGDNVSVYSLMFRWMDWLDLTVTIGVFLLLLALWCRTALVISRRGRVVTDLVRGGEWFTAIVFVIVGAVILIRTGDLPFFR